ncbi:MAG: type II toxin-antitoxin system RelE/ParE family toxin [Thaumarchaeota archaeon]|nr:type II toxin-antitoxin system RelE/ParE family toxin [Nitrososphaerota archaeon]
MFEVSLSDRAEKNYRRLPAHYRNRVLELLAMLQETPVPADTFDIVKLRGFADCFRARIGDIRIIFQIKWEEAEIRILVIEFRGRAYK